MTTTKKTTTKNTGTSTKEIGQKIQMKLTANQHETVETISTSVRTAMMTASGRTSAATRRRVAGVAVMAVLFAGLGAAPASAIIEKLPSDMSTPESDAPVVRPDLTAAQWQIAGVGAAGSATQLGTANGRGMTVAVLSDGVDDLHPDLRGVTVTGWDATTKKAVSAGKLHTYGSSGGNGTFQATVIAGTDDGAGIRGIAPGAKVLPVVVDGDGDISDAVVADGIRWSVAAGAKLITLSLGVSEGVTSAAATATCAAITAARASGVLTFVPAVNDELMGDASYRPADCSDAVVVTAVGENLANKLNRKISTKPTFSAPGYGIVGGTGGGSNLPYTVASSTLWASATAAGAAAAIWSARPTLTADQLVELITATATELGETAIYGAGLVDVTAALGQGTNGFDRRTTEVRRSELAAKSVPVVVDANRGGDGRTSLTWLPPFESTVERYQVVISRWSATAKQWTETTSSYDGATVRAVVTGELNDKSYATVVAYTASGERRGVPVNSTWYNPAEPTFALDDEEAAVTKGSTRWVAGGIEVSVEVNDKTRPWLVLVIDPVTGEPVKHMNVPAGKTTQVVNFGELNALRNRSLLVAAGMGRNGVDMLLLPQYGLSVSVVPVGKTRAGVTGTVTCATDTVFNCGDRDLVEGSEVTVLDAKSKKVLATAVVRSDRSFSAVWSQKSSSYDVVVVAGKERSMRYTSSFFVR